MEDLNDKVLGSNLSAGEWNQVPSEIQNVIEGTGQGLTNGDLNQLGKGIADYVGSSNFYADGGSSSAYVLSSVGAKQPITAYVDGLIVSFVAANSNVAGVVTVTVNALGVITIDNATEGNEISKGKYTVLRYDAALSRFLVQKDFSPVGVIQAWPTATVPLGYLECDGADISRTDFVSLFDVIGLNYGTGSGTTFTIPDLRGEFIRGFNNGEANDPDAGVRTDRGDGTQGDNVGTKQLGETAAHIHNLTSWKLTSFDGTGGRNTVGADAGGSGSLEPQYDDEMVLSTVGNETRPRNVYMMYIIKF